MKPIKKIMTLVVFLFSLCFPLASCQKQYRFDFSEEGWTIDNKQYLNRLMVKCSALNNPPERVCLFSSCVQY